jgi:hypothetical protein
VLGELDELFMLLGGERLCLAFGNQRIESLLHGGWEALIDFQQEFRLGLRQMGSVLSDAEHQQSGDKLF